MNLIDRPIKDKEGAGLALKQVANAAGSRDAIKRLIYLYTKCNA